MKIRIYLAGACKGLPDLGKEWRRYVRKVLSKYAEKIYDPTLYFARDGSDSISDKQVKNFYLKHLIRNSDLILVNLNDTQNSVGTGQELQYAVDHNIPVIGFGKENVYEWLPDDCDVVFDTLGDAIDYITDFFID